MVAATGPLHAILRAVSVEAHSGLRVTRNKNFGDFERLPLQSNSYRWSGSAVPVLQERAEYLESLLPLLVTVDLLRHKQHVEQQVQYIRLRIEQEKKSDFMED